MSRLSLGRTLLLCGSALLAAVMFMLSTKGGYATPDVAMVMHRPKTTTTAMAPRGPSETTPDKPGGASLGARGVATLTPDEAAQQLAPLLQSELARIEERFGSAGHSASAATVRAVLRNATSMLMVYGSGVTPSLGARLMDAYVQGRPFVIGVTGGSSSAGNFSWPFILRDWLEGTMGVKVEIRNAAHGTTSQLGTAPCIRALLGDGFDLLLWEFAMNDERRYLENEPIPEYPQRRRLAESFIRQLIAFNPPAVGFIHLWDLFHLFKYRGWNAHDMDTPGSALPNKPFAPTLAVLDHYHAAYTRHFSIDVIRFMWTFHLYQKKRDFLRDLHHPNNSTYSVVSDLVAYALVAIWVDHLRSVHLLPAADQVAPVYHPPRTSTQSGPTYGEPPTDTRSVHRRLQDTPMMAANTDINQVMPGQDLYGHCYVVNVPQFAVVNTITAAGPWKCTKPSAYDHDCIPQMTVGKTAPGREDRHKLIILPPCDLTFGALPHINHTSSQGDKKLYFSGTVSRSKQVQQAPVDPANTLRLEWQTDRDEDVRGSLAYMLMECHKSPRPNSCMLEVVAFVDGVRVEPNVPVSKDPMKEFLHWVHNFDHHTPTTTIVKNSNLEAGKRPANRDVHAATAATIDLQARVHTIQLCGVQPNVTIGRVILLERRVYA